MGTTSTYHLPRYMGAPPTIYHGRWVVHLPPTVVGGWSTYHRNLPFRLILPPPLPPPPRRVFRRQIHYINFALKGTTYHLPPTAELHLPQTTVGGRSTYHKPQPEVRANTAIVALISSRWASIDGVYSPRSATISAVCVVIIVLDRMAVG